MIASKIVWRHTNFNKLKINELYNILVVRQQVFMLEQHCLYEDLDDLDQDATHLSAYLEGQAMPVAYARILKPNVKYEEASIGRILTTQIVRGQGLGRELIKRAIDFIEKEFMSREIRISAQLYLKDFYIGFGFKVIGEPYMDAGIEHITMLRSK